MLDGDEKTAALQAITPPSSVLKNDYLSVFSVASIKQAGKKVH